MGWNEEQVDRKIGRLLQVGVFLAAAVMAIGGFVYLVVRPEPAPDYRHFQASSESFRSIPHILADALRGRSAALIQVGTLLMIATPVARVLFAAYAFARGHDRTYVGITLLVLALLLYGILLGR